MGCYVNPRTEEKEAFLLREGQRLTSIPTAADITVDSVPVCLVNNGFFTACAVAYSANELRAFADPGDPRPKLWFKVPRTALYQVSDLKNYE